MQSNVFEWKVSQTILNAGSCLQFSISLGIFGWLFAYWITFLSFLLGNEINLNSESIQSLEFCTVFHRRDADAEGGKTQEITKAPYWEQIDSLSQSGASRFLYSAWWKSLAFMRKNSKNHRINRIESSLNPITERSQVADEEHTIARLKINETGEYWWACVVMSIGLQLSKINLIGTYQSLHFCLRQFILLLIF